MIKLKSKHQSSSLVSGSRSDSPAFPSTAKQPLPSVQRLVILVPSLEANLNAVAGRIWELANTTGAHVLFLGLYSDRAQEPALRRELVTMAAMVRDEKVSTETVITFGKDWVDVVKTRIKDGDTIVCFAEQYDSLSHKPLSEVLQSNLKTPLYILSGLYQRDETRSSWPAQIAVWMGSLAIIVGFFLLQVKVDHLTKDWTHTLLLLLSIPVELGLILAWNSLFE